MATCTGCGEEIENRPMGAYGGDWVSGCNVCEWTCEGGEHTRIKQGLTRDELVLHKKDLNNLYAKMHLAGRNGHMNWALLDELRDIMEVLLELDFSELGYAQQSMKEESE